MYESSCPRRTLPPFPFHSRRQNEPLSSTNPSTSPKLIRRGKQSVNSSIFGRRFTLKQPSAAQFQRIGLKPLGSIRHLARYSFFEMRDESDIGKSLGKRFRLIAEIKECLSLRRCRDIAARINEFDAATCEADRARRRSRFLKPSRIGVIVCEHDSGGNAASLHFVDQLENEVSDERLSIWRIK